MEHAVKENPTKTSPTKQGSFFGKSLQSPFFTPVFVQPKLTIGPVDDPYEREADAVADRVMRMSDTETLQTKRAPINIQRKCTACEEKEKLHRKEDEEEPVQLKPEKNFEVQRKCEHCEEEENRKKPIMRKAETGNSGMSVSSSFTASLNASKGGGSPLPQGTRSFMENAFRTDFSKVKIHANSKAAEMSKDINARAFTYGNDIYFAAGQYSQNTYFGKNLLAHELTHVVQQRNNYPRNLLHRKENILDKKIEKIIAFKGQLHGQAVLSDKTVVDIQLLKNTLDEPGTYTLIFDPGQPLRYRRDDLEQRKGAFIWENESVYGEKFRKAGWSEQVVVVIIEGDQMSQMASIEALPAHIKKFLLKGEGNVASYEGIQVVADVGLWLQANSVTEDELLLLEIETQNRKENGDSDDPLSWVNDYIHNRQEKGEEALMNRSEILEQIEVGALLRDNKDQAGWALIKNLLNKSGISKHDIERVVNAYGLSYQTIIDTFDFELKSVTETFLSQSLIALLKTEKEFFTDSLIVSIGQRNLQSALDQLKVALELKNRASSESFKALKEDFINNPIAVINFLESNQVTDLSEHFIEANAEFEAKSKYLQEVATSVNLPVLEWHGFNLQKLISEKNIQNKQGLLKAFISDARQTIGKAQGLLKDTKNLYSADKLVTLTKANLGIKEKTIVNAIIDYHKKLATEDSIWDDLIDLASLLVIFIPGGIGTALRVGVGLINAREESDEFDTKHTMYAAGLSSDDPSMLGSVLAIGGVFIDASEMAKGVVKVLGAEVKGATKAADELQAVETAARLAEGEKRIGLDGSLREVPAPAKGHDVDNVTGTISVDPAVSTENKVPVRDSTSGVTPVMELNASGLPKQLSLRFGASKYKIPAFKTQPEAFQFAKRTGRKDAHILFVKVFEGNKQISEWYEVSEIGAKWVRSGDTEQKALSRMNLHKDVRVEMYGSYAPCTHGKQSCSAAIDKAIHDSGAAIEYYQVHESGKATEFEFPRESYDPGKN